MIERPSRRAWLALLVSAAALSTHPANAGGSREAGQDGAAAEVSGKDLRDATSELRRRARKKTPPFDDDSKRVWQHLFRIGAGLDPYTKPDADEVRALRTAAFLESARVGLRQGALNNLVRVDAWLAALGADAPSRWDWLADLRKEAFKEPAVVGGGWTSEAEAPRTARAEHTLALWCALVAAEAGEDDRALRAIRDAAKALKGVPKGPARELLSRVTQWTDAECAYRLGTSGPPEPFAFPPEGYYPGMLLTIVAGPSEEWVTLHRGRERHAVHQLARVPEKGVWRFRMNDADVNELGLEQRALVLRAEGWFQVPAGRYRLNFRGDDGLLVYLDGGLVADTWHGEAFNKGLREELLLPDTPQHLACYVWDTRVVLALDLHLERHEGEDRWVTVPLVLHLDPEMAQKAGL